MDTQQLANQLRQARENKNLSQKDLAEMAQLPQSQISKLENAAIQDPGFFTIARLSQKLGISLASLAYQVQHNQVQPKRDITSYLGAGLQENEFFFGLFEGQYLKGKSSDLNKNMWITGDSGTGKSSYMHAMINDLAHTSDQAIIYIDPSGENTLPLISKLTSKKIKDIVLLSIDDADVSYNPLDVKSAEDIPMRVELFMEIFQYATGSLGRPATRQVLANAVAALCYANLELDSVKCTPLHLMNFLVDIKFRQTVVQLCPLATVQLAFDPVHSSFEIMSERKQLEITMPIIRMIQPIGNSPAFSQIFRHAHNSVNWRELFKPGVVVIIQGNETPAGKLFCKFLLSDLMHSYFEWGLQYDQTTRDPKGCGTRFFVDDAHEIVGHNDDDSILTILAESRKWDIGCIFASDSRLAKLARQCLYANTKTKLAFETQEPAGMDIALSAGDGTMTSNMIQNLDKDMMYLNALIDGQMTGAMMMHAFDQEFNNIGYSVQASQSIFGKKVHHDLLAPTRDISYTQWLEYEIMKLLIGDDPPEKIESSQEFPW